MQPPATVAGSFRPVTADERRLVTEWMGAFQADVGEVAGDPGVYVDRRLRGGQLWCWDDGSPVSMAALSDPVEGVVRVQAVYTPPDKRNQGYGAACVAAVSSHALERGDRCILYTDLGNPTSNSIYRRIGYSAVAEVLRYEFSVESP